MKPNGIYPRNVNLFKTLKSISLMQEIIRLVKTNKQRTNNHTLLKYTQGEKPPPPIIIYGKIQ